MPVETQQEAAIREVNIHELATLVKSKRGKRGLREVAQQITEEFGEVSASTLSRVEQGKVPDLDVYMRLCRWLGASPGQFATKASEGMEMSTPEKIEAHLRADRELEPQQAEALAQMMRLAYDALAQGAIGKKKGG